MIYDLIEFGRWLNENNQDSFGKHVKDTDYILNISYENNKFQLNDFMKKEEICNLFYENKFSLYFRLTPERKRAPAYADTLPFSL